MTVIDLVIGFWAIVGVVTNSLMLWSLYRKRDTLPESTFRKARRWSITGILTGSLAIVLVVVF